jgi:hypothetical protein
MHNARTFLKIAPKPLIFNQTWTSKISPKAPTTYRPFVYNYLI